jgi:phage antirepressor YoqD-like protein
MNALANVVAGVPAPTNSIELLALVNEARAAFGEGEIRRNDFTARCKDEIGDGNYESFVVPNPNGTESEVILLAHDQCLWVLMRESKAVRRAVTQKLNDLAKPKFAIPQNLSEALRLAADLAEQKAVLEQAVAEQAPKALFHDQVVAAPDAISMAEAAKVCGTGRTRFMALLRQMHWLTRHNEPYQDKIEAGLMDVKLSKLWDHPDQGLKRSVTPLLTGKGLAKLKALGVGQPLKAVAA